MDASRIAGRALALILLVLGLLAFGRLLLEAWTAFTSCPNRDVLSWDANLRFLTVLDMRRDFAAFDLFAGLRPIFDSPTWPALRPVLALIGFAVLPGGPSPVADVAFTYAGFVLLLGSLLYCSWRIVGFARGVPVWLAAVVALFAMREIWLYALSAMLEIQGMFFGLLSAYWLFVLYRDESASGAGEFGGAEGSSGTDTATGAMGRWTFLGLFFSTQGLYHTKYPYGVMFLIALALLEIARLPYGQAALRALPTGWLFRGRGGVVRLCGYILYAVVALLALGGAARAGLDISARGARNLLFAATLLLFIDLNLAIYRGRDALRAALPARVRTLYWAAFFPAVLWMLVHPDRFNATLGTRDHVQDASRSFLSSLAGEVWLQAWPFLLLCAFALVFLGVVGFRSWRAHGADVPGPGPVARALALVLVLWCLQLAVLELTTPNKQLRHVYHLLPALLLLAAAAPVLLPELFSSGFFARTAGALALVFFVAAAAAPLSRIGFGPDRVCFTGTNTAMLEPARVFARAFRPHADRPTVMWNAFHRLKRADGSWPAGRYIASDIDMLLRQEALARGGDLRVLGPDGDVFSTAMPTPPVQALVISPAGADDIRAFLPVLLRLGGGRASLGVRETVLVPNTHGRLIMTRLEIGAVAPAAE